MRFSLLKTQEHGAPLRSCMGACISPASGYARGSADIGVGHKDSVDVKPVGGRCRVTETVLVGEHPTPSISGGPPTLCYPGILLTANQGRLAMGPPLLLQGRGVSVNPTGRKVKGGHYDLAGNSRIGLSERDARRVRLLTKYVLDRPASVPINPEVCNG